MAPVIVIVAKIRQKYRRLLIRKFINFLTNVFYIQEVSSQDFVRLSR